MLPIDCLSVLYMVFILVESDVSIALWYEIQMFLKFKLHENCFCKIKWRGFLNWCYLDGALSQLKIETESATQSLRSFELSVWNLV